MERLTKPQRLIYDMEKFHGGSISVICGSIVTKMEYPAAALIAAVNELYRRNDALRIRMIETDSGPMQEINDYAQWEVKVLHFGLTQEDYGTLRSGINTVVNAAASVKHYGSYQYFKEANVDTAECSFASARRAAPNCSTSPL